jgi:hypothetical protein
VIRRPNSSFSDVFGKSIPSSAKYNCSKYRNSELQSRYADIRKTADKCTKKTLRYFLIKDKLSELKSP